MSAAKKPKPLGKRIERAVTAFLAIALMTCVGLAIWASENNDARVSNPLNFVGTNAANPPDETPVATNEAQIDPTDSPAPDELPAVFAAMPKIEASPEAAPEASPEATPMPDAVDIVISAVGDITMGREVMSGQSKFDKTADDKGLSYFFSGVVDILSQDDLTIGNLEGPLTTAKSYRKRREFIFKGKPKYAEVLTLGSVEAVTIANNHSRDFHTRGQKDTQKALQAQNVTWFGFENTAVYEVKGIKIGLIGLTEWNNSAGQLYNMVKKLSDSCDMVVVGMHWGAEGRLRPTAKQKRMGRAAIDAGAVAVFGHHTHVVGAIEIYKGRTIAYSLGNFCFAGNTNPQDKDAIIVRQVFTVEPQAKRVTSGEMAVFPCSISSSQSTNDFRPTPLTGKRAREVVDKVRLASKGLKNTPDFKAMMEKYANKT